MAKLSSLAALLFVAQHATAAPIRYNDWVIFDDTKPTVGAQLTYGNDWEHLPIRVDISGDDATGEFNIHRWEVYSQDRTQLVHAIPPQSVDMTFGTIGWRGQTITPEGSWLTLLYPRGIFGLPAGKAKTWRIQLHTDVPIRDVPGVRRGQLEVQIVQAPEPATLLLGLLLIPFARKLSRLDRSDH